MKTIGLLGGTGWESTVEYYKIINKKISETLGYNHSAKIAMFSIDFFEISSRAGKNDFEGMYHLILEASKKIESAGAECLLICANTLHMFADDIARSISIPLIHIADATAEKIKEKKFTKTGLLGTKPTMEMPFYKNRLKEKHDIDVIIPEESDIDHIHKIITTELLQGIFKPETKAYLISVMDKMVKLGAESIILGCTDFPLIVKQSDTQIVLFDTAEIHAKAAVEFALS
ncbi:MAG: aspartate/glutamate racemase family protein [Bacteroidota bacterium]